MQKLSRSLLATGLALALAALYLSPLGQRIERDYGLRALYALRGPVAIPQEAVIVALERRSVEWMRFHAGDFSAASPRLDGCLTAHSRITLASARNTNDLPRGVHACLLEAVLERGAALVVFDVLFNRATPDDARFAGAIREAGNVLLFERIGQETGPDGQGPVLLERQHPRPLLAEAARGTAMFSINAPTNDAVEGYFTRIDAFPGLDTLPRLAWTELTGRAPPPREPLTRPIWLYGPPGALAGHTLRDVFDPASPNPLPPHLGGRVVFVGLSMPEVPGTRDHFPVPVAGTAGREMGGVELMASAFLNRLHGHEMTRPGPFAAGGLVFAFGLVLFSAPLFLGGWRGALAGAALLALYGATAAALFSGVQVWLPFAAPVVLGGIAAMLTALVARYAFASALVGRLAPAQVASELLSGREARRRAVRMEEATVLFADLVGSTRLGDRLSPSEYNAVMTRYYDASAEAIEAEGGMLIEFTGDGVMAVFSRSVAGPAHAARAVRAARSICARIDALGPAGDNERLRLRIGLHTGETATGDIGARHRFNYKVLGDTVNVAARLEILGKAHDRGSGHVVLASDETVAAAGIDGNEVVPLGPQRLRGKAGAIGVSRLS